MKLTESIVRQFMEAVFKELQSERYKISTDVQFRMSENLKKCKIYITASGLKGSNLNRIAAKVVEHVRVESDCRVSIDPCLYIARENKNLFMDEVFFHEIVHLFSIGSCFPTNSPDLFLHRSGLELYHIYTSDDILRVNNCGFLNELLNDAVAAFLYNRLTGKVYHGNNQFSCLNFQDYITRQLEIKKCTEEQLVRAYFSHEDETLKKILLSESGGSFEQLEEKLCECYLQKIALYI